MEPENDDDGQQTAPERTRTVVIGCGLSGMAVAAELNRQGVESIVVSGPVPDADAIRDAAAEPGVFPEQEELRRVLQGYLSSHRLDVRGDSPAQDLSPASPPGLQPSPIPGTGRWAVRTGRTLLLADTIVLTSCSLSDLRRLARDLGAGSWPGAVAALREIGVYFVGVGGTALPTVRALVRQAKATGAAIAEVTLPASPRAAAGAPAAKSGWPRQPAR